MTGSMTQPNMRDCYKDNNWNGSMFRDPEYEALWEKAREEMDRSIREPMVKKLAVMYNSFAPAITFPAPNVLHYAWPWVKNYTGEYNIAYIDRNWLQWVWIDQAMRTEMIGEVD